MFKKILAATDNPRHCDAPIEAAIKIAARGNAQLHILHTAESVSPGCPTHVRHHLTGEDIVADTNYLKEIEQVISSNCRKAFTAGSEPVVKAANGLPWEEILRLSDKIKPDLLVLGPHRSKNTEDCGEQRSGIIGSTLEGVIRKGRYPLMIVNRSVRRKNLEFKKNNDRKRLFGFM